MYSLSVLDKHWDLTGTLENDDHFDYALELSAYYKGQTTEISEVAQDIVWIRETTFRQWFVEAMLFVDGDPALIGQCIDMKKESIEAYKSIFFEVSRLRGQLGKTEYYEIIMSENDKNTQEYSRASMLREAHLGGPEVIMEQFNINLFDYSLSAYKDTAQKVLAWKEKVFERDGGDYDQFQKGLKAKSETLNVIQKASANTDSNKMSDIAALTRVLEEMHAEGLVEGEIELDSYNVELEEVIGLPETIEEEEPTE